MIESLKKELDEYCKKHKLDEKTKADLKKKLENLSKKGKFEPGECLGIVTTQSVSEPATQMTMRTFHFAGSAGLQMTLGLPRLIELFDLRKNIDGISTVYLEKNSKDFAGKVASEIYESKLENVVKTINYDVSTSQVEVDLDKDDLAKLELKPQQIHEIVKKFVKKYPSDKKGYKIVFDNVGSYSEFRILKEKLLGLHIKGIKGVKETVILNRDGEWIIQIRGGSFKKIISLEGVDSTRTVTTNIEEIASVLGIEAARQALINEIKHTLEEQGVDVDVRYLGLVADTMCLYGELDAVSRYGIMRKKKSVLARLNFEETIKILFNSTVLNKKDTLNTLMANLMIGKVTPQGTGTVKLKWKL
jgi:DNA-directed RNA polymerase subunit A"